MRRFLRTGMAGGTLLACVLAVGFASKAAGQEAVAAPAANKNFKVAVYIPVNIVERMSNRQYLESTWKQISAGVKVNKVYIETYRSREMASGRLIESVKKFFLDRGVEVAGGIAYSDLSPGQFRSFVYTNAADRAYVEHVAEFTAKHFNEIILDDFFFDNTKEPSDIAAKGNQSWSQFRLKLMDEVARDLVVGAARKVNPKVKVIIKFPNWYPSFQGNGYDLAVEPSIFNGIYTGTETRDPVITDQQLQQYESYEIIRYFDNVAPGRNGGGWVDTFSIRYVDRYAEQLWDTMLAKAPQIMLFEYSNLLQPAVAGDRGGWANMQTSFDYQAWWPHSTPDFAAVAGKALNEIDPIVGKLGNPIGVAVYRPLNSTGEDFLPDYLGEIGIPIEMYPYFPTQAKTVLLTAAAAHDAQILAKIKAHLMAGGNVVITTGLLRKIPEQIAQICELRMPGNQLLTTEYWGAYGAGNGASLGASEPLMVPEVDYITNDAWPLVRGTANGRGAPLLLMDRYGNGILYVLTIPDNFNDLYRLPQGVLTALRSYIGGDLPETMDAPSQVSLMEYGNHTFVVQSFRNTPVTLTIAVKGDAQALRNLATGRMVEQIASPPIPHHWGDSGVPGALQRAIFRVKVLPHSFDAFAAAGTP